MTNAPSAADLVITDLADGEAELRDQVATLASTASGYRLMAQCAIAQLAAVRRQVQLQDVRIRQLVAEMRALRRRKGA